MSKRMIRALLCLLCLGIAGPVLAQGNPTVEIVLSQPTAQQGDTVTADVYVRNSLNVGGADIGITLEQDTPCVRIVDRQPGGYLPTTGEAGAFSPLATLEDDQTRLAAAVTDRSKIASGDGVFFRAQLAVTCERGEAAVRVTFAQLASYKDPAAEDIELISYRMEYDNLDIIDATLVIGPTGQVTPAPSRTPMPTQAVTPAATAAPAPAEPVSPMATETLLTLVVIAMAAIIFILLIVVFVMARRRRSDRSDG